MQFKQSLLAAVFGVLAANAASTDPVTVITHDGSVETIWWVPTATAYWTPSWWGDYTSQGGKLAEATGDGSDSDGETIRGAPVTTTSDGHKTTFTPTVRIFSTTSDGHAVVTSTTVTGDDIDGTTSTGSAYTTTSDGHKTTVTPTVVVFSTTENGRETQTTSTLNQDDADHSETEGTPYTTTDSKGSSTTVTPTVDLVVTTNNKGETTTSSSTVMTASENAAGQYREAPIVGLVSGMLAFGLSVLAL